MHCRSSSRRSAARRAGSTYAYDICGLLRIALTTKWAHHCEASKVSENLAEVQQRKPQTKTLLGREQSQGVMQLGVVPENVVSSVELVMDWDKMELAPKERPAASNDIGMVAWQVVLKTLEYPEGRVIVLIANDVTFQAGSFGVREDHFFQKASEYARSQGLPRIYVSCNSGARVGLVEELKALFKIQWIDAADPNKGFSYLYLTPADYEKLEPSTVTAHLVKEAGEERYVIDAIIGEHQASTKGGIGVENLQGSGLIAGETSRAYQETFTLSYITGRSVGIGAYLNRLGQRNIQLVSSPMVLTGYSALNKLLGKNVYTSQDQLGGPQIMVPNGVTHQVVKDDQEGMAAILNWLSYVPRDAKSLPPMLQFPGDSWDRDVEFVPPKQPYDPRDFLRGASAADGSFLRGFFDTGSFSEYLEGWGRTVVVGRARLGGIPMGVIAVETRSVERLVPADPANPESRGVAEPQAGQVWFPDSAFKTAQALRDFNRAENLPVMVFANWRGFSGGTRDMYGEILKYGAQIVDALVEYQHPIFVYIPPNGELRGGAWVVIDPQINPDKMEMYADVDSRGGILEPPGIVEVKFRKPHQLEAMHRHDTRIIELDAQLAKADGVQEKARLEQEVKMREKHLLPLYTSIAVQFADLHDRAERMVAKGVIRHSLEWRNSRRFFYWRVRRRVLQDFWVRSLREADERLSHGDALECLRSWIVEARVNFASDEKVAKWLEAHDVGKRAEARRALFIEEKIGALLGELPEAKRLSLLRRASCTDAKKCAACTFM